MTEFHIITCEYPPRIGGVSDHTFALAAALADDRHVHVWAPRGGTDQGSGIRDQGSGIRDAGSGQTGSPPLRVIVHQDLGTFRVADLVKLSRRLNAFGRPRHVLVQWVPHGYGWRALNVPFAMWVATRALVGDRIELLVHEPYLEMSARPVWLAAALVQRAMLTAATASARRIWVSTPSWIPAVRPYALRRQRIEWLPIPAPVLPTHNPAAVAEIRKRISPGGHQIVGHFSSYSRLITSLLEPPLIRIAEQTGARVLLIGHGSAVVRERLASAAPALADRCSATGALDATALSQHLQACDIMLQPYPDGISARRTTAVALLAHGLPTVTNLGRLSEAFWTDSNAVALVDSPSADALGERVRTLLADPDGRRRLSAAARELHDRVFAVRHAVARLFDTAPSHSYQLSGVSHQLPDVRSQPTDFRPKPEEHLC